VQLQPLDAWAAQGHDLAEFLSAAGEPDARDEPYEGDGQLRHLREAQQLEHHLLLFLHGVILRVQVDAAGDK